MSSPLPTFHSSQRKTSKSVSYDSEESIKSVLIELLIYFLFLTSTTIVAISSRDIFMYYFNQTIDRIFLKQFTQTENGSELDFASIVTTADLWTYIETTFLDGLKRFMLQGKNETSLQAVADENLLLGPARIRQIRVKNDTCHVNENFRNYFRTCYGKYTVDIEDDRDEFLNTKYHTLDDLQTQSLWGQLGYYHGGGYVQSLSFNSDENSEILNNLKDSQWMDRGTRVVVLEFSLYNGNLDLFCNAKLIGETPSTGGVFTSNRLQTLMLNSIWTTNDYFGIICAVVFYSLIICYTVEEIREIRLIGIRKYISSVWNWLDCATILIGYLSMGYNIWHPIALKGILNKFTENPEEFLSIDIICFWNLLYIDIMAICVFLVWIKIFKYIGFNKTMLQFSTTLKRCSKDLFGFAIMFAIVFCAYAQLGLLLFGTQHPDFRNFSESILTMMRMVLGDFDYSAIEQANRVLGPIYFLTYILLVFFILLNMFLAIINDTYSAVKGEVTQERNQLQIYFKTIYLRICNYLGCKKSVPNGDEASVMEDNKPILVEPPRRLRRKDILNTYFEVLDVNGDVLTNRVTLLEGTMEKLMGHLDVILQKLDANKMYKSSNRGI